MVKNMFANPGDIKDAGPIPGSGSSPGGGHGNPLQYSCLENPMDRGAWWLQSVGSQRVRHDWSDLTSTRPSCSRVVLRIGVYFGSCSLGWFLLVTSPDSEPDNRAHNLSTAGWGLLTWKTPDTVSTSFLPTVPPLPGIRCLTEVTKSQGSAQCLEHSRSLGAPLPQSSFQWILYSWQNMEKSPNLCACFFSSELDTL